MMKYTYLSPHPRLRWTLFCLMGLLSQPAFAEESPDIIQQVLNPQASELEIETAEDQGPLSIEEIVNPPVFSASNTEENALTAPAWVIIITGDEMRERGYIELSQILDDLPGIDVARVYGPTWFRSYWRGRRSGSWGDNFLFMIDNIPWHDHVYDNARMMIPISYIERVEIVYGPGSLIHGSNAMMGSINVVTKKQSKQLGTQVAMVTGVHAPQSMIDKIKRQRYITDFSLFHKSDDFRLSISGRIDQGFVDEIAGDFDAYNYEWTRSSHFGDEYIWGSTLLEDYPNLSGEFRSPFRNLSLDARFMTEEVEIGFQFFDFQRGTGLQFAGDRYQNQSTWHDIFYGAHFRHTKNFERLQSQFLARFRASVWPSDNTLLYMSGSPAGSSTPGAPVLNRFEAENFGVEINQFLKYQIPQVFGDDRLILIGGINYAMDDVVKSWDKSPATFTADSTDADGNTSTGSLDSDPDQESESNIFPANKLAQHTFAAYFLAKYNFFDDHHIDLGIRQTFTQNANQTSYRAAYVLSFWDRFTFKAIVGQAFKVPSQRQTYGFNASKLDEENYENRVETSNTYELGLNYNSDNLNIQLSPYFVVNNSIYSIDTTNRATKLYAVEIFGVDLAAIGSIPVPQLKQLKVWAYLTWYPFTLRTPYSSDCSDKSYSEYISDGVMGHNISDRDCWIGDIANLQVKGGVTVKPINRIVVTALARYVNKRVTVNTNPIDKIDPYITADATIMLRDLVVNGLNLSFSVTNILDSRYFHPGVSNANSDNIIIEDGAEYTKSLGAYNSLLPQPGRAFQILLSSSID